MLRNHNSNPLRGRSLIVLLAIIIFFLFLAITRIGGGGSEGGSVLTNGSLEDILGGSDASFLDVFVQDPKARRAMTHPSFQVPSLLRALRALPPALVNRNVEVGSGSDQTQQKQFPTSMSELRTFLDKSSVAVRARFNALYEIEAKKATMKIPEAFAPKVKAMFSLFPGGLSGIENQTIITIYNKFTDEYSLFNEVRRYRPGYLERLKPEQEAEVSNLYTSGAGADQCDFCSMERTAQDIFGRLEGNHCYIASNVAKYEAWHSLIVSKHHNPLTFDREILHDYFLTAQKWFTTVNKLDPDATFPFLSWDAGPRASASQIHQHMQLVLTHDRYLSKAESTRRAASNFERRFPGRNYWQEVSLLHGQMGLAVSHGNTVILSHVCPVKEREIILITADHTSMDFVEALDASLEALRDDVGVRAISMGITFHTVGQLQKVRGAAPVGGSGGGGSGGHQKGGDTYNDHFEGGGASAGYADEALDRKMIGHYPTIARIIDRGSPLDKRSDTGAMEYFGANNVGADPYFFMTHIRGRLAQNANK